MFNRRNPPKKNPNATLAGGLPRTDTALPERDSASQIIKRRGRPRKHASPLDRVHAFRQKKRQKKAEAKLLRKAARILASIPDTKGRIHGEDRSGGRSVLDLPEFNQLPTLGPVSDDRLGVGPSLGGSFLQPTSTLIGDRRRNTFDPDKPTREAGDIEEKNESESAFTRRQNWGINWGLGAEKKKEYTNDFVNDYIYPVLWCPWPRQHDIDPEDGLPANEDEDENHLQVVLRCWLPMPTQMRKECGAPAGTQCIFRSRITGGDFDSFDGDPNDPYLWIDPNQWDQARAHIERNHQRELHAFLNSLSPAKVKTCSAEDHSRLQLEQILAKQRDKVRCGRCNKIIYDPAKNHPDASIRRQYD